LPAYNFFPGIGLAVEFRQETGYFLTLESAITPWVDAICPYPSHIIPASQGVGMNMEEPGYFLDRQHFTHIIAISHIFSHVLYN
jgi:hypothetical protein